VAGRAIPLYRYDGDLIEWISAKRAERLEAAGRVKLAGLLQARFEFLLHAERHPQRCWSSSMHRNVERHIQELGH
jgi:hypothetical protein